MQTIMCLIKKYSIFPETPYVQKAYSNIYIYIFLHCSIVFFSPRTEAVLIRSLATALVILGSRGHTGQTAVNLVDVRIVYCCLDPVRGVFRFL